MAFKFERLDVWIKSIELADSIFEIAQDWPKFYRYSLVDQISRAASSIPTNIAEGTGRDNPKESRYFYSIAKGSVYEVVSLLVIAGKRGLITRDHYRMFYQQADEIAAMLNGLINRQKNT